MPKLVELEDGRVIEFPDGMSDSQIDANLRLSLAGEQGIKQAESGAVERSKPSTDQRAAEMFESQLSRAGTFGTAPTQEDIQAGREANIPMLTLGAMAAPATIGGAIAAPAATAKGLLGSLVGGAVGNEAGQWVGRRVPVVGGEMLGDVLGGVGGLVGGVGGGMAAPKLGAKELLAMLPGGGKGGMLAQILGRGEAEVAKGAATQAAKTVAPEVAEEAAKKVADRAAQMKLRERAIAAAEERNAIAREKLRLKAEKPGPRAVPKSEPAPAPRTEGATALKPEPEFIPDEAVSLVAEPLPFRPRGTTKPATNLGGKAKPGPAPTPPDKLEETLRASLDAIKEKKASKQALQAIAEKVEMSPLQAPRIQVGAQRVGKTVGMTKEEVRKQAGPVLDETLGEASPILPIQPFQKIIDTMKAIPRSEREAYVARATSGKTKWQVENIRRTLEHLGLLLPAGAAVGAASSE